MAKRRSAPPARTDTEALVYRWGPSIDAQLLDLALTHRSYAHEIGGQGRLGDGGGAHLGEAGMASASPRSILVAGVLLSSRKKKGKGG